MIQIAKTTLLLLSFAICCLQGKTTVPAPQKTVRVDYKPVSICEETPGVQSFSGYIRVPPETLGEVGLDQSYPINIFFWYFQSRAKRSDSPLTVYLNGGPGASSLMSLFKEHGPCKVNADSNSTRHNQWSWNAESDILYIDQPVQTGFSYDRLEPGVLDAFGNVFLNRNQEKSKRPFLKQGSRQGIFSSNDPQQTANSTESIVRSTWFYLQAWLQNFHGRQQSPNSTINFWTSSYGGHFAPRLVKYALEQNVRLKAGELDSNKYMRMQIGSLGITNSCADGPTQLPYYPEMARNNSYNIPLINQEDYHTAIQHLSKPGGCISKIEDCRAAAPSPSLDLGQNETVNAICHDANTYCGKHVAGLLSSSGTSFFDIAYRNDFLNDPLSETYFGYLNQRHIQDTLGVQLNFSGNSPVVAHAFSSTGDNVKAGYLEALGSILDSGVNVALIYGDRDFACNWLSGKALAESIPYSGSQAFSRAGIVDFTIPLYPKGAQVRQAGPLSFVRVYSAGHTVAMQQPQIAQALFNRAIAGLDLATGNMIVEKNYTTVHQYPSWEWEEDSPTVAGDSPCYILNLGLCSPSQRKIFLNGSGTVRNYFLIADDKGKCIQNPIQPCKKTGVQSILGEAAEEADKFDIGKEEHSGILLKILVAATGIGYIACIILLGIYWRTSRHGHLYSAL